MSMKSWLNQNMDVGDWITLGTGFVALLFAIAGFYWMTINRISTLEKRTESIQHEVRRTNEQWNGLIKRLDNRYVGQQRFSDFRGETNRRLEEINSNVKYLIQLQIEGNNNP